MQQACTIIAQALAGNKDFQQLRYQTRQKSLKDLLQQGQPEQLESISEECLQSLEITHPYMTDRGFSQEVLQFNKVGYYAGRDASSFMRGRIVFPIRDLDCNIIGFTGRALIDDAKERQRLGISKWLHSGGLHRHFSLAKKSILYNAHQAKGFVQGGTIILVEGPIDVLRLQEAGIHNVCAVLGTQLSRQQEMLIRSMGARIIVPLFDADSAGQKTVRGMRDRFSQYDIMSIRIIDLPEGKDPGDLTVSEIKEILHEFIQERPSLSTGSDGGDEGSSSTVEESSEADAAEPGVSIL